MNLARRALLKFAGGAAAGTLLTPMPWKMLSDSAIWSQNWSWIPKLPTGPRSVKYTSCTLCPAGCGVKARCVGEHPVTLTGAAHNPLSQGTLCALGVAAHQLPYHPKRASRPLEMNTQGQHVPVTVEAAVQRLGEAISKRPSGTAVAVLDERPGRTMSVVYRRFLGGLENGVYLTPPERETATAAALVRLAGGARWGIDFETTAGVVSFGAPLLDGWGIPAQVHRARLRADRPLKIVQVETKQSRTASLADMWLPVKPDSEAAMALGIANVLVTQALVPAANLKRAADADEYLELIAEYTPERVAEIEGVPPESIQSAAKLLAANQPAVAIGGGDPGGGPAKRVVEAAIAGLNLLLGSVGVEGGFTQRDEVPVPAAWSEWKLAAPKRLDEAADGSIGVLILGDAPSGEALPWTLIARKLARQGVLVSLAPFVEGASQRAHLIVPAPAFLEGYEEVPTPPTAAAASLVIAAPLVKAPAGAVEPATLLAKLGGWTETLADLLKQRVEAIHQSGRGTVAESGGSRAVKDFAKASDVWDALAAGGTWTAEAPKPAPPAKYTMLGGTAAGELKASAAGHGGEEAKLPLLLLPYAWRGASGMAALPSPLTKVYQESLLRAHSGQCRIHPDTAFDARVRDGDRVEIRTESGSMTARLWVDESVMPGVLEVPAGPQGGDAASSIVDICGPVNGMSEWTWRSSRARVRRLA